MVIEKTDEMKEKIRKANRRAYIAEAGLEYFISLLFTGAFLAAILKNIGVPDAVVGITSSLASFGFTAEAFAVLFIHPKGSLKKTSTILHFLNQLMFCFI